MLYEWAHSDALYIYIYIYNILYVYVYIYSILLHPYLRVHVHSSFISNRCLAMARQCPGHQLAANLHATAEHHRWRLQGAATPR